MVDVINFPSEDPLSAMDAEVELAHELLPAWFIPRMMTDSWSFGLLLNTGHVLCIESILKVRQGADGHIWLDVEMMTRIPYAKITNMIHSPTSRTRASVQASRIVAAFELADT